ncbi:DUF2281 domain-containing protein [Chitinibacter sp. FCG-7]|uniref:DUF2281 domain-containing protein n=1 Tax=Chitinibacter mangrovi TaxID=3153927 RepID=A0AAU7F7C8_9NEIS
MTQAQRLIELANTLPEAALAEVVDFAEFVAQKQARATAVEPLEHLIGSLKEDPAFANCDPLAVQNEMRNEWVR